MYTISAINGSSTSVIHANDPDSTNRLSAGKFADEVNAIPAFNFKECMKCTSRFVLLTVRTIMTGSEAMYMSMQQEV